MFLRCSFSFVFVVSCALSSVAQKPALDFIRNAGQWPGQVRYMAAVEGGSVFLTNDGFTYSFYSLEDAARIHDSMHHDAARDLQKETVRCHAYRVRLEGANPACGNEARRKRPHYYNFFLSNDASKWAGDVAAYEEVSSDNIYKGIDLHVYSTGASLKYDFIVAPGADAGLIQMKFDGVEPTFTKDGDLLIKTSVNEVREQAPYAYQVVNGKRQQVACRYVMHDGQVGFAFPDGYDQRRQLVIDPVLIFSTYSGSSAQTLGWSAAYDSAGNLYAGGQCLAPGWPATVGAFQSSFAGLMDVAINKYDNKGTSLIYSTYYGGSYAEAPAAMLVNHTGELIVAGATTSANLPVTSGCFDSSANGGSDIYVAHFNAAGTALLGATYIGGSGHEGDVSTSVGILANRGGLESDSAGNIYIAFASTSADFPTTSGAYQRTLGDTMDAVVFKLDPSCSNMLFSTYLGGNANDAAIDMKLTRSGQLVVSGGTTSTNFPGTSGGWQSSPQGTLDGFVAVLDGTGSSLLHATYVGTAGYDDASKLAIDASGNIYVAGMNTGGAFPVTPGCYSAPKGLNYIARFDSSLSTLMVSTTLADSMVLLNPTAFAVDRCGNLSFAGFAGYTPGLPTTPDAFLTNTGSFWMCRLSPNLLSLDYASYFGAVGDHLDGGCGSISDDGILYHSLCTRSTALPTTPSAWSSTKKTGMNMFDIFSWKLDFQPPGMAADFSISPGDSMCAPGLVTFQNTSTGALSFHWDFGDGSPVSTLPNPPPHLYADTGSYQIKLITYNIAACKAIDSALRTIHVYRYRDTVKLHPPDTLLICAGESARMNVDPKWAISITPDSGVSYLPKGGSEILFHPGTDTRYEVIAALNDDCGTLRDTIHFTVAIDTAGIPPINPVTDTILCKGDTAVYALDRRLSRFFISPAGSFQVSSDSMSIRFFPAVTTRYRFIGIGKSRCRLRYDTLNFTIHRSKLKAAFDIRPRVTDMASPTLYLFDRSQNAVTYDWFLNEASWSTSANPSYTATDTGFYCFTLVATDAFHCQDTASDCGEVFIPLIYVPSAFTPNGDEKNEIFRPVSRNLEILEFSVYNRFGQRVFVTSNNRDGWDGTFNGKLCDVGTYFYQVRYRVLQREPGLLKGDVTLLR